MNHIDSSYGKWFHRIFVKGCIAGFFAWNLGWRLRDMGNVYRGMERRFRGEGILI